MDQSTFMEPTEGVKQAMEKYTTFLSDVVGVDEEDPGKVAAMLVADLSIYYPGVIEASKEFMP